MKGPTKLCFAMKNASNDKIRKMSGSHYCGCFHLLSRTNEPFGTHQRMLLPNALGIIGPLCAARLLILT